MRTRDVKQIFQFRYYIIDLQKQLEYYCSPDNIPKCKTVYRGQLITQLELSKLKRCIGKYISLNTYLSTSLDEEVVWGFSGGGEGEIPSIIYEIDIRNVSRIVDKRRSPICINSFSQFAHEAEVVFPFTSTFFVTSIQMIDKVWYMKLKLTDDDEHNRLINSMQSDLIDDTPLNIQFVELYISSNGLEKSEQYVKSLIEDLKLSSDSENLKYILHIMGQTCSDQGLYERALSYFDEVLTNISLEDKFCATIYQNIANTYMDKGEYDIAQQYLNRTLDYKEQLNSIELASLYETFSCMYREIGDFDNALDYVNQAFDIHRGNLSSSYHQISTITCLAWIYFKKSDFNQSLRYFKDALNLAVKYVSKDQSLFIHDIMIGFSYLKCNELSLAMTYLQRALKSIQIDSHPVPLIFLYRTLAELYYLIEDIEETYKYAQQAYDIYNENQHLLQKRSYLVIQVHITWAIINSDRSNWNLALNLFLIALKLTRTNAEYQMLLYFEMGKTYLRKSQTGIAIRYFKYILRLIFKTEQPFTYDNFRSKIYYSISQVYERENNREKAIFYIEHALKIQLISKDPNFDFIISYYTRLMNLCPQHMTEYIEKIRELSNNPKLSTSNKCSCEKILGDYFYENQKNFPQALIHYELYLKYTVSCIPIYYENLISAYQTIGNFYCKIDKKNPDIDRAIFYYEEVHKIYVKLSNMDRIPIIDKKAIFLTEKQFLKNINQSSYLNMCMSNIYYSLATCYIHKKDLIQAFFYLCISEKILNDYNGPQPLIIPHTRYSNIGFKYKFLKRYDKAIECFEKKIQKLPDGSNEYGYTYQIIAECYRDKGDFEMALSKYKIALTFLHNSQMINYQDLFRCYYSVAILHQQCNNHEYASKYFEQTLFYESKLSLFDRDQHVRIRMAHIKSLLYMKSGDYHQKLKYALEALQYTRHLRQDTLVMLFLQIGTLYVLNEMYYDALLYFDKALKYHTQPDELFDILTAKIRAFQFIGNFDKALEIAKQRINIYFNHSENIHIDMSNACIDHAEIYYALGKYRKAMKSCQLAIIFQSYGKDLKHINYVDIYENLALIYLEYGQEKEARSYCWKARSIHFSTKKIDPIVNSIILGLIECKSENYYRALESFGRAWESIFNRNIVHCSKNILYNYIGYAYFKLNQVDLAMKFYVKSLLLYKDNNCCNTHPDIAKIYRNIGLYYEQIEKNYSFALSYYQRALELVPNRTHPHYIQYQDIISALQFKIQHEPYSFKKVCSLL